MDGWIDGQTVESPFFFFFRERGKGLKKVVHILPTLFPPFLYLTKLLERKAHWCKNIQYTFQMVFFLRFLKRFLSVLVFIRAVNQVS